MQWASILLKSRMSLSQQEAMTHDTTNMMQYEAGCTCSVRQCRARQLLLLPTPEWPEESRRCPSACQPAPAARVSGWTPEEAAQPCYNAIKSRAFKDPSQHADLRTALCCQSKQALAWLMDFGIQPTNPSHLGRRKHAIQRGTNLLHGRTGRDSQPGHKHGRFLPSCGGDRKGLSSVYTA